MKIGENLFPIESLNTIYAKASRRKEKKGRELKHLSTDEEKSTERPKVVASEIGKACKSEKIWFELGKKVIKTCNGMRKGSLW